MLLGLACETVTVHGWVADLAADTTGFAEQVLALLADDALWCTLFCAGADAITERFGLDVARAALQDLLDTATKETPR